MAYYDPDDPYAPDPYAPVPAPYEPAGALVTDAARPTLQNYAQQLYEDPDQLPYGAIGGAPPAAYPAGAGEDTSVPAAGPPIGGQLPEGTFERGAPISARAPGAAPAAAPAAPVAKRDLWAESVDIVDPRYMTAAKPPAPSYAQEVGRAAVRAVAEPVLKGGELAARVINYTQRQLGLPTDNTDAAIAQYKETIPQFEKDWGTGYANALEAWHEGGLNAAAKHAVGTAVEGVIQFLPALKAGKIAQGVYGGVLGAINAAERTDGDPGATMYGAATGAAAMLAQLGIFNAQLPFSALGNITTRVLGLGAVGEAQTLATPAEKPIAGQGPYQTPSAGELVEPSIAALFGFFGRNRAKPGEPPPPAAPEVTPPGGPDAAQTLALSGALPPAPPPNTRPVPPETPSVSPGQEVVPPGTGLPRPPPPGEPPLPLTTPENPMRRGPVEQPPSRPDQFAPAAPPGPAIPQEAPPGTGLPRPRPEMPEPPPTAAPAGPAAFEIGTPPEAVGPAAFERGVPRPVPTGPEQFAAGERPGGQRPPEGPTTVQEYVDGYMAGRGRGDPAYEQFAANNGPEIEAEFNRRAAQQSGREQPLNTRPLPPERPDFMAEGFGRTDMRRPGDPSAPVEVNPPADPTRMLREQASPNVIPPERPAQYAAASGDRYLAPERWVTERDHTVPGQWVTKNAVGEVIGLGDTPELARAHADGRAAAAGTPAEGGLPNQRAGLAPRAAEPLVEAAPAAPAPANVGEALTAAKATGEKPAVVVETVKRRKIAEKTAPAAEPAAAAKAEPAQSAANIAPAAAPAGSRLVRRSEVQAREAAAAQARTRPVEPAAPAAEPEAQPLRRQAEAKGEAAGARTLGDVAGTARAEQSSAERLASTTTNRTTIGRALIRDLIDKTIPVARAVKLLGSQAEGRGRPRTHGDLHDLATADLAAAEATQAAADARALRLRDAHDAEMAKAKPSVTKLRRIASQLDVLAQNDRGDYIQKLREVQHELSDHIGKPRAEEAGLDDAIPIKEALKSDLVNRDVRELTLSSHDENRMHGMHDYLRAIIKNPAIRTTARHLWELARQLQARLPDDIQMGSYRAASLVHGEPRWAAKEHTSYGTYFGDNEVIGLRSENPMPVKTALHEILHRGTYRYFRDIQQKLDRNEPLTRIERQHRDALDAILAELSDIRRKDELLQLDRPLDTSTRHALDSALRRDAGHEIATHAMTDPDFMRFLAEQPASPELTAKLRDLGYEPGTKTLWDAFKNLVSSIFGGGKKANSTLSEIMQPLTDIVEHGTAYETAYQAGVREQLQARLRGRRPVNDEIGVDDPIPPADRDRADLALPANRLRDAAGAPDMVNGSWHNRLLGLATNPRNWAREGVPALYKAALQASGTPQLIRWNRDALPELTGIAQARDKISAAARQFLSQDVTLPGENGAAPTTSRMSDVVHNLMDRLSGDTGYVADLSKRAGEFKFGRAARLGTDNFEAANAHLATQDGADLARARAMQDEFDQMSPRQQKLYQDLRDHYARVDQQEKAASFKHIVDTALPEFSADERTILARQLGTRAQMEQLINSPDATPIAQALGERWQNSRAVVQELARAWRDTHVEGDYFPLQRFGDWIVTYGDKQVPVGEPGSYGMEKFERRSEAEARKAQLQQLGATDVHEVRLSSAFNRTDAIDPRTVERLDQALRNRGWKDERVNQVHDAFAALAARSMANSARSRMMPRRQGIAGASTDAIRILANDTLSASSRIGHAMHGGEERAAISEAERAHRLMAHQAEGYGGRPAAPNNDVIRAGLALDEMKLRGAPLDGDMSSSITGGIGRGFTRASAIYQLIRPAHMVLQLADTQAKAASFLGGKYGFGRSGVAMAKAFADVAPAGWRSGMQNMATALRGEMRASNWDLNEVMERRLVARGMDEVHAGELRKQMEDAGFGSSSMTLELRRWAQQGGFDTTSAQGLNRAGKIGSNMMDLFAAGQHSVDVMNRYATAKAAFDLAMRDNGGNALAAARDAVRMVHDVVPSFEQHNLPRLATARGSLGQFGAPILQYKVYGMQMYATMANLVREARYSSGAERTAALKSLAGLIGTHSLLVGVPSTVMGSFVLGALGAYDYASGRDKPHDYVGDFNRAVTDLAGPTVGHFVQKGLFGLANIDAGRSVGLANMAGVPELRGFDQGSYAQFAAGATLGASGSLAQQLLGAGHDMLNGNWARGFTNLAPRIIRDPLRAGLMATEGIKDPRGSVILKPGDISASSIGLTAVGFNPDQVARFREGRHYIQEARSEVAEDRRKAVARFLQGDQTAVASYNNSREPGAPPIKRQDLLEARKRELKKTQDINTYGLEVSKKQRPYALPAGQF